MTAPLTPPDRPQPSDPWRSPPEGSHLAAGDVPAAHVETRAEVRQALLTAVVLTVAGLVLGLLWLWLAPRIPLVSDDTAVYLKDSEGEEAIGADGTYALIALGLGVVSAVAVFLWRRRGGIWLVAGLALGALLGSLLGWGVGVWFGPTSDVVAHAKQVGEGVTFDAPLELNAKGAVLVWPIVAMAVHLALTAAFGPRDPEPEPEWPGHWTMPGAAPPVAAADSGADAPDPATRAWPGPDAPGGSAAEAGGRPEKGADPAAPRPKD
ncbi:ABC transporter permease [uncultured Streptomyces sp.]|uniref:ABC transporter permease n=1 Tax=uncultured Streptomyces sp. TaxID=174707 RepID=UPI0026104A36|nr:ABC transporter permease [uncultured Streptomyces sp.]